MAKPELSIVVLAWNNVELTRACVESIRANTEVEYELIVVDNGSTDGGSEYAAEVADVAVLHDRNLGFAPGMNSGLERSSGQFVAFVNNDTVLPDDWAGQLLETMGGLDRPGIVLPAVTASGNPVSVRSEPGDETPKMRRFIDLPSGVIYLMPRVTAIQLGGWDERYKIASREDLDLLFTCWCNDLDVVLDERVLVHHELNATAKTQLADRDDIWIANWGVFIDKWTHPERQEVPRLDSVPPDTFERNKATAAVAAHWMGRWYPAWNSQRELSKRLRSMESQTKKADPQEPSASLAKRFFKRNR